MYAVRELPRLLRAAYLAMHRVSDDYFSRYGVTDDQYVLLARLTDGDAITQQELARRVCSDPSTTGAMLALLERRGLVARQRDPHDSRARLVTLTAQGRRVFQRLRESSEPIRIQMAAGFSEEEVRALVDNLRRLAENLASARARFSRKRAKRVPSGSPAP